MTAGTDAARPHGEDGSHGAGADVLSPVERRALQLASVALNCAYSDDWKRAGAAVQRIGDECGGVGLARAILGWSDTLLARLGHTPGNPVELTYQQVETGRIDEDGENVPGPVRWAGKVLAARGRLDQAEWEALMDGLPEDGAEVARHVAALLETVTLMLRQVGWSQ